MPPLKLFDDDADGFRDMDFSFTANLDSDVLTGLSRFGFDYFYVFRRSGRNVDDDSLARCSMFSHGDLPIWTLKQHNLR